MIVTDNNSQELLASELPLVLDFHATWCGPCRQIAPSIAELTDKYGIRNVPTVIFIKNGEIVDKFVGSMPKAAIKEKFEKLL